MQHGNVVVIEMYDVGARQDMHSEHRCLPAFSSASAATIPSASAAAAAFPRVPRRPSPAANADVRLPDHRACVWRLLSQHGALLDRPGLLQRGQHPRHRPQRACFPQPSCKGASPGQLILPPPPSPPLPEHLSLSLQAVAIMQGVAAASPDSNAHPGNHYGRRAGNAWRLMS